VATGAVGADGQERGEGRNAGAGRWEGREEVEKAGQEGWELVSVQPFISTHGGESWAGGPGTSSVSSYLFFFKRPSGKAKSDPVRRTTS
jgi:hypothetical protein